MRVASFFLSLSSGILSFGGEWYGVSCHIVFWLSRNCYTFAFKIYTYVRVCAHGMRVFRKLDIYILKDYLLLFSGTFFICLFIFMMQFMWRYVDELVGKGLSMEVLAKFFYYSGACQPYLIWQYG